MFAPVFSLPVARLPLFYCKAVSGLKECGLEYETKTKVQHIELSSPRAVESLDPWSHNMMMWLFRFDHHPLFFFLSSLASWSESLATSYEMHQRKVNNIRVLLGMKSSRYMLFEKKIDQLRVFFIGYGCVWTLVQYPQQGWPEQANVAQCKTYAFIGRGILVLKHA